MDIRSSWEEIFPEITAANVVYHGLDEILLLGFGGSFDLLTFQKFLELDDGQFRHLLYLSGKFKRSEGTIKVDAKANQQQYAFQFEEDENKYIYII